MERGMKMFNSDETEKENKMEKETLATENKKLRDEINELIEENKSLLERNKEIKEALTTENKKLKDEINELIEENVSFQKRIIELSQETPNEIQATKPDYYKNEKWRIECIEVIRFFLTKEEFNGYLKGSYLKYQWRKGKKGNNTYDIDENKSMWNIHMAMNCGIIQCNENY